MKLQNSTTFLIHLASWLTLTLSPTVSAKDSNSLAQVRAELRNSQFNRTCELVDQALTANDPSSDELLFLKATALFHAKKFPQSIDTTDTLHQKFPDSSWSHKATFLKAQALIEQRKFAEASVIYESEASRILSPDRKQALAGEILKFAQKLETKPAANTPDAPQPNYDKAYSLYKKALTLELSREFRDDIIFRKACAIQSANNHQVAIQDFQAYLNEYDPSWTGPAGSNSPRLALINPPPAGKHVALARFNLAKSYLNANMAELARMELEDLLKIVTAAKPESPIAAELAILKDKPLTDEIRWLTVQTYFTKITPLPIQRQASNLDTQAANPILIGNTGGLPANDALLYQTDLEAALKSCRDYLTAHPVGSRAILASWIIAESLEARSRGDDAIAAYRDFIAGKGFQLPAGDAATQIDEELRAAPATHLANLQMRALHRIGNIQAEQGKFEAAITTWKTYIKDHPNGSEWSDCQNSIINAEFQLGMTALTEKNEDLAKQRFDEFLRQHPLDARAPRILFLFGAIHQDHALSATDTKKSKDEISAHYHKAIDEWAKLVSKYPDSSEATEALFVSATTLEYQLADFEKALKIYQKIASERGDPRAHQAIQRLTQKTLTLTSERVFRTHEAPTVKLNTRNIESCEVRVYRIDLQAYFRKKHAITGVESLDVSLIQPDKTWTYRTQNFRKYQPLEDQIEIPFANNDAGACVVTVSSEDWESTVLVLRSDLEMILKSSQSEVLAFIQNMRTGQPAANVDMIVSDGKSIIASGKSSADGIFKAKIDAPVEDHGIHAFALLAGHSCSHNLDLEELSASTGLSPKGFLYTDRPCYLPGETVSMRAILRDVKNDSFAIPEQSKFSISFSTPDGKILSEQTVTLSPYGTFNACLNLPATADLGIYSMTATQLDKDHSPLTFQGSFEVAKFKLEKIKLSLEAPKRVLLRGETLEATIHAAYYWGTPIANRELRCILPDNRIQRITTDANGNAQISFDTTSMPRGSELKLSASLEGDQVSLHESFFLAYAGYSIKASTSQPVILTGESVDLHLKTTTPDGKPTQEALTVAVYRSSTSQKPRILSLLPWQQEDEIPLEESKISELKTQTDPTTGKATLSLKLDQSGEYQIRVTGTDRMGQTITEPTSVIVSGSDDTNKLRLFADSSTLKVGQSASIRLHSRLSSGLALLTFEGESILRYQIIKLQSDYIPLPTPVGHDLFPNFRLSVAAIDGKTLHYADKEFTVERELKVAVKPLKNSYLPGETGEFELLVTDQTGKPVVAELSLALVNEALYAVKPDATPAILDFFHSDAERVPQFILGSTCNFSYIGTSRPIAKALTDEENRLARKSSEETLRRHAAKEMEAQLAKPAALPHNDAQAEADPFCAPSEKALAVPRGGSGFGYGGTLNARGQNLAGDADMLQNGVAKDGLSENAPRIESTSDSRWLPSILTDASGKAVVTLKLPDTTTAWRLTARGCSVDTLVGEASSTTLTRKDFFVELKLPDFLREGDEVRVLTRLHNQSTYAGKAPLTLRVLDGNDRSKVLATRESEVVLKPNSTAETTFPAVTIPQSLNVIFEVVSTAGTNRDQLEKSLAIMPWGLPYAAHAGGVASSDVSASLKLPNDRPYQSLWMSIALGPEIEQSIIEMALQDLYTCDPFASSLHCPIGTHPSNQLLATATALSYANASRTNHPLATRLAERCRSHVASLVSTQAKDGSWSSPTLGAFTTARTFWALIEARNAGIKVNPHTLDRALQFLNEQLARFDANDNDSKAIILHALSCDKRADFAACNRLYRDRNSLTPVTLAYLTRAFFQIARPEIAAELATILEAKAPDKPELLNSAYKITWLNDAPESTAIVLLALAESKPESKRTEALAQALMQAHGCYGFNSNRAHGPAIAALTRWLGAGKPQSTDLEVAVIVNGKEITTVKSAKSASSVILPIPPEILKADLTSVDFKVKGRGRFSYAATLFGFSPHMPPATPPNSFAMHQVQYLHAPMEYRGKPIAAASTSIVNHLENGQRTHVEIKNVHSIYKEGRFTLEIALPPGTQLDESSLTCNSGSAYTVKIQPTSITIFFENRINHVGFDLTGYSPGKFRMLPPVIREIGNPNFISIGPVSTLNVLAPNEKSPDAYQLNIHEHHALGSCYFNDGDEATALEHLSVVAKENPKYAEADLARMLLWIYTNPKFYDAAKIIEKFEILRERFPSLEIPFDRILVVCKAYRDINEFERASLVYRAIISASFTNDSSLSAILEDEGKFIASIDFQQRVCNEYPDSQEVITSYFTLSQLLFQKSANAHQLPKEDNVQPEKIAMLTRTAKLLNAFLSYYPNHPLADDAAFSLCNCMLELKNYPVVVSLTKEFAAKHTKSPLAPSFQYMTALGLFWQNLNTEALQAAQIVANGNSNDSNFARYILGQIYHAQNQPAKALEWYHQVKSIYPDAAAAIRYFENQSITLDEVKVVKPGTPASLNLKYRNIKEAFIQVYRVDLMKLYLQQKNLSAITSVQLAGIKPESEQTITLGDGKDYIEKERSIPLPLKDEAAYLVICRGDNLFASGMILITPLKIEVQEEPESGSLRANIIDTSKGGYRPDVHVKAIGSANSEFNSGETDLRGLFIANNLRGKATVIAREGNSRYAFFRGNNWLGAAENKGKSVDQGRIPPAPSQSINYQGNLEQYNRAIQIDNNANFDKQRRQAPNKGIKVEAAY